MSVKRDNVREPSHFSVEGISGTGKTYFLSKLRPLLPDHTFVTEVSDRKHSKLDAYILSALREKNDQFFRTGYPQTETALLIALKAFDFESVVKPALDAGKCVWEDRSIDTIAVYQAILCNPKSPSVWADAAEAIYQCATSFRSPPHKTFLLVEDFHQAIKRAEERSKGHYSKEDLWLLREASNLYEIHALKHRDRIVMLDRRHLSEEEIKNVFISSAPTNESRT